MLCDQCHWQENEKPFKGCDFCMRLDFPEDILCSIVRNGCDDGILLECNAYKPKLSIASPNQQSPLIIENNEIEGNTLSNKEKYFIALSKQKLNSNPDEIYFNLQFHVCLVTKKREAIFLSKNNCLEEIITIFNKIETMFDSTEIEVLHINSDHIHLYVNTSPDYSFDEIADKIINVSEKEITTLYPELMRKDSAIWEVGYFAETIG
jgi:REP element-mobilizing transposase RayT